MDDDAVPEPEMFWFYVVGAGESFYNLAMEARTFEEWERNFMRTAQRCREQIPEDRQSTAMMVEVIKTSIIVLERACGVAERR